MVDIVVKTVVSFSSGMEYVVTLASPGLTYNYVTHILLL